jgi:hypothetical protein
VWHVSLLRFAIERRGQPDKSCLEGQRNRTLLSAESDVFGTFRADATNARFNGIKAPKGGRSSWWRFVEQDMNDLLSGTPVIGDSWSWRGVWNFSTCTWSTHIWGWEASKSYTHLIGLNRCLFGSAHVCAGRMSVLNMMNRVEILRTECDTEDPDRSLAETFVEHVLTQILPTYQVSDRLKNLVLMICSAMIGAFGLSSLDKPVWSGGYGGYGGGYGGYGGAGGYGGYSYQPPKKLKPYVSLSFYLFC